jgi:hypothetical protein
MGLGLLDLEDEEAQAIGDAEPAVQSGTCRYEVVPMQLVQPGKTRPTLAFLQVTQESRAVDPRARSSSLEGSRGVGQTTASGGSGFLTDFTGFFGTHPHPDGLLEHHCSTTSDRRTLRQPTPAASNLPRDDPGLISPRGSEPRS